MDKRKLLTGLSITGLILFLFIFFVNTSEGKEKLKPNVIIFYVDDLGWMDLSCQGSNFYETPAIDKLAKDGVRFTQAYTAHPRCVPARYGLMTGKYPARGHVHKRGGLVPEDVTIAEAMHEGGYKTYFAGKWHLMFNKGDVNLPENQGFDVNIAGGHPGSPPTYFYPYKNTQKPKDGAKNKHFKDIMGLENGKEGEYLTDRLTDETVNFIKTQTKDNPNQPFFAVLCHYGVHTPFEAKPELVAKYKKKLKTMKYDLPEFEKTNTGDTKMRQDYPVYAAMIESVDQSMAKLRGTLDSLGIADNTIIIFSADNGGLSTRGNNRKLATSNYPLRNGKGWLNEGGIREAFIVDWPGVSKAGTINDAVTTGTDIYPTVLEMVGLDLRPNDHKDGISIVSAIKGEKFNRTTPIFWHSPLARPSSTGDLNSSAVRLGDYKLIDWYDNGKVELYNLNDDIGEANDLSKHMPKKAAEMLKLVQNWRKSIDATIIDSLDNRWYRDKYNLQKPKKKR